MAITPLPPAPSRSDAPALFISKANLFIAALPPMVTETNAEILALSTAAAGFTSGASATSFTLATGSKVFTLTTTGKLFPLGVGVKIARTSAPGTWAHGDVTAFADPTLTVNVTLLNGSGGPFTDWTISISGLASLPALTLLSAVTASGSATVDMETTFSNTYDAYMLVGNSVVPVNDNPSLLLRLKIGGSYIVSTTYQYHSVSSGAGAATYLANNSEVDSSVLLSLGVGNAAPESCNFVLYTHDPDSITLKHLVHWNGVVIDLTPTLRTASGVGSNTTIGALTGMRLFFGSGNIASGTFRLYGITN